MILVIAGRQVRTTEAQIGRVMAAMRQRETAPQPTEPTTKKPPQGKRKPRPMKAARRRRLAELDRLQQLVEPEWQTAAEIGARVAGLGPWSWSGSVNETVGVAKALSVLTRMGRIEDNRDRRFRRWRCLPLHQKGRCQ